MLESPGTQETWCRRGAGRERAATTQPTQNWMHRRCQGDLLGTLGNGWEGNVSSKVRDVLVIEACAVLMGCESARKDDARAATMRRKPECPKCGGACGGGKLLRVVLRHGADGELGGWVWVGPVREGWWAVSWTIDTLDRQYDLSEHWFSREACNDELARLLNLAASHSQAGIMGCSANVRWGSAWGLSAEVALGFARGLWELWRGVVDEWAARAGSVNRRE
jgi:hypothetical protein